MAIASEFFQALSRITMRLTALFCLTLGLHAEFSGDYTNHFHSGDLVFQTPNGKLAVWFMDGIHPGASVVLQKPIAWPGWHFAGIIPIGGDAHAILWQERATGMVGASLMEGTRYLRSIIIQPCNQYSTPGGRIGCAPSRIPLTYWTLKGNFTSDSDGLTGLLFQSLFGRLQLWRMSGTDTLSATIIPGAMVPRFATVAGGSLTPDGLGALFLQTSEGELFIWDHGRPTAVYVYFRPGYPTRLAYVAGLHDFVGLGIESLVAQTPWHHLAFFTPGSPGRSTIYGPYVLYHYQSLPDGWELRALIK